jgi:flagellar biosynthesis protein FlhF
MRIKSYFADSVQEAIEKARIELGPDAMLMNSKKTDPELRSLGAYEVIFGVAPGQIQSKAQPKAEATTEKRRPAAASTDYADFADSSRTSETGAALTGDLASGELVKQLADLRHQIETVRRSVTRQQRVVPASSGSPVGMHPNPGAAELCAHLLAADLSEDLAQEIAEAAELRAFASRQPGTRPLREFEMLPSELLDMALHAELERRLQVAPELGTSGRAARVVLLAGPGGSGKTTALVKLALRYGLRARQPMHLLSLDTLRVGGWEQMASYARIAGIGFEAVHNWNTLTQVLDQQSNKKLIFIDTPGIGVADMKEMAALTACCSQQASLDVHLVFPATLRSSAASRLIERFRPLGPAKLLLTHTDEIESTGSLVDLAIRSRLPLSYLSCGQNIPEDITEAFKEKLLSGFVRRTQSAAA